MEKHTPKKRFHPSIDRTTITGQKLFRKYHTKYLFMLYGFMKSGIDIRTSIWLCYDKLEVTNG